MSENLGTVYNTVDGFEVSDFVPRAPATATQTCWPELSNFGQSHTAFTRQMHIIATIPKSEKRFYTPFISQKSKSPPGRKVSFKQIKSSGLIRMTPYSVRKETIQNFLVHVSEQSRVYDRTWQMSWYSYGAQFCPSALVERRAQAISHYEIGGDLSYWKERYPLSSHIEAPALDLHRDEMAVMSETVSNSLKTYDLFTDLAELRSTLGTIAGLISKVRRPLQSFKDAREVLKSKGATHKAITQLWMQYRYAIMPIMYGIEDASKLADQLIDTYKTARGKRTVDHYFNGMPSFSPDKVTFFDIVEGSTEIRGTGKARYITSVQRLLDQTSFNTATAVWEVLPYSLVVDWVANAGEWLQIHTSSLANFASQRMFCISSKTNLTVSTYIRVSHGGFAGYSHPGSTLVNGDTLPKWEVPAVPDVPGVYLIQRRTVESYDRRLFSPNDVELQFDVQFSNWKRWADGYVMSLKPLTAALRRLLR